MIWNNHIGWKKKLVYTIVVIALVITQGYLLVGFEIQGWNTAIELTTYLFNKPVEDSQVNVPHAQETIDNLLRWTFGSEAKVARAVFRAESGLRCNAEGDGHLTYQKNGITFGGSYGIAQIRYLPGRPTPSQLKDCKFNIQYAKLIRDRSGWNAWSSFKSGAYKKYLNT